MIVFTSPKYWFFFIVRSGSWQQATIFVDFFVSCKVDLEMISQRCFDRSIHVIGTGSLGASKPSCFDDCSQWIFVLKMGGVCISDLIYMDKL